MPEHKTEKPEKQPERTVPPKPNQVAPSQPSHAGEGVPTKPVTEHTEQAAIDERRGNLPRNQVEPTPVDQPTPTDANKLTTPRVNPALAEAEKQGAEAQKQAEAIRAENARLQRGPTNPTDKPVPPFRPPSEPTQSLPTGKNVPNPPSVTPQPGKPSSLPATWIPSDTIEMFIQAVKKNHDVVRHHLRNILNQG